MYKIIGVGNKLMCDDGIALKVLNEIKEPLYEITHDIEIICGETDYMYCLEKLNKEDIVVVIDSAKRNKKPGMVSVLAMDELDQYINYASQHQVSLFNLIPIYHKEIKAYAILIEVFEIKYQYGLSDEMSKVFLKVCCDVYQNIKKIVEENPYA